MINQLVKSEDFRYTAAKTAQVALYGYRSTLKAKMYAADRAVYALEKIIRKDEKPLPENKKERDNMKRFISTLAAVAAAGVALGAAGYYLKKKKEAQAADYEELLYSEEMGEDFVITEEPECEVSDTFVEVKEAIDNAMEE